jgi:xylono-1,5-lactonase
MARTVWQVGAILGEGPVWIARENAIYFVDIKKPALHRYALADGAMRSWDMPEPICWIIPRLDREDYIAGFKSGFAELSLDPLNIKKLGSPEPQHPGNRLNDAKVDAWGRIWAGSMDDAEKHARGALHRLDPDLKWQTLDEGYFIANGPTFSPDGYTLYHTDSARRLIYAFDLSSDGRLANRRIFVRFEESWGFPDGMSTDANGGVWVAHWGGARVSRFTPRGELERSIALPTLNITSCVFAGENLDRMFVTSASIGVDNDPLAGALFEVDPGVRGAYAYLFGA